ncbi:MAG: bifunctional hydroxymethylpyrimidine kinase/phosphomethylpyrimidine kinase [Gammaproteobacteria bacterium]
MSATITTEPDETILSPPIVWSIAGSDSGGGAGIQADLKAFEAFGVHGCTALTAITAQHSQGVERIEVVPADLLDAQLSALATDLPPRAIKIGLLGSADNARCVSRWIDRLRKSAAVAVVLDPLQRATTGAAFCDEALRRALREELLPRATLITPNRAEAAWLLGDDAAATLDCATAARTLRTLEPASVVITGGDAGSARVRDWVDTPEVQAWLEQPRITTPHHHGTGCVFSAAAAAGMARGFCITDALILAKMCTTDALRRAYTAGQGAGPVRPDRGFARQRDTLPTLVDGPNTYPSTARCAPLVERNLGLYAIVDSAEWVARAVAAGVRTVQLRIKHAPPDELTRAIARSVQIAATAGVQLFINDHWQLAVDLGAYGIHLGQDDLRTLDRTAWDQVSGAGLRVGISTHSLWEVCRARAVRPSYIACGPIHATTTKEMPWLPQGTANLAYWSAVLDEPVIAIAGMDEVRSREAMRCGAAGVAVLRGIMQAADPEGAIQRLQAAIAAGRADQSFAPPAMARPTLTGVV